MPRPVRRAATTYDHDMRWLFDTDDSHARFVQRLVLAVVMSAHGAQKLLGWFGGGGLDATVRSLGAHLPVPLVYLVVAAETVGPILLAVGLLGRLAALGTTCVMAGAVALVHAPNGFFMNWAGKPGGEGFEYHLLALALAVPIVVKGSGAWSIDRAIARRRRVAPERRVPVGAPTAPTPV
jgi:putative oxidoreductase